MCHFLGKFLSFFSLSLKPQTGWELVQQQQQRNWPQGSSCEFLSKFEFDKQRKFYEYLKNRRGTNTCQTPLPPLAWHTLKIVNYFRLVFEIFFIFIVAALRLR